MKRLILGLVVVLSLGLAACGSDNATKAKAEPKPATIPSDAITQLVEDMKTRDNIKDASFKVNGDKITMKLVVDGTSLFDKKEAQKYADGFLRSISMYTDNKPTSSNYGKIYKNYYVDISVDDGAGITVIEGKKLAGYDSFDWE